MSSRLLRRDGRSGLAMMSVAVVSALITASGLTGVSGRAAGAQGDENTYVNPTYGYQIDWDQDVWGVIEDGPGDVTLASDLVEIYFQSGQFYAGDATACRDDLVDRLPDDDTVLSSEPYEADGEQAGEADGRAFETLQVELDDTDDQDARTVVERIDCRTIVAGEAVLAITWLAPIDDATDATASAEALLDALVIPSFQGPGADVDGLDGGSYVDSDLGLSLDWDDAIWTSFVPVDAVFGLNSATSLISFSLPDDFDGDAAACVERSLDDLSSSPGIVDVTAIERDGAEVAGLDDAGWSYAAIDANYGGAEQFVEIRCAAIPGTDLTLRAVHSGPIGSYEGEADLAAPVFASLVVAGSAGGPDDNATPAADEPTETAATPAVEEGTPVPNDPDGTPEPSLEDTPAEDFEVFPFEAGGWSLAYDQSVWSPLDPALYTTVDLALGGETSVVSFDTTATDGRAVDEVLADAVEVEIVGPAAEESDFEQIDDSPVPFENAVGDAYRYETAGGAEAALAIVVVPVDVDTAVVVRIYGSAESLSNDFDALELLLSGLKI